MQVKYNVTGARRKELVKVIADTTGAKAEYKFMPTCNYEIDYFTVTKDGTLLFDDRADSEEVERVLEAIAAAGFECEPQDGVDSEVEEESETEDSAAQAAAEGLTVAVPRDSLSDAALENLQRIVDSKAALMKKALGADSLPIEVTDEKVSFPWFTEMDGDSAKAYMHLVSALCENGEKRQARDRHGKGSGQREVRIPLFPPAAGLHRRGVQGRAENPAEEPHRLLGFQEWRCRP